MFRRLIKGVSVSTFVVLVSLLVIPTVSAATQNSLIVPIDPDTKPLCSKFDRVVVSQPLSSLWQFGPTNITTGDIYAGSNHVFRLIDSPHVTYRYAVGRPEIHTGIAVRVSGTRSISIESVCSPQLSTPAFTVVMPGTGWQTIPVPSGCTIQSWFFGGSKYWESGTILAEINELHWQCRNRYKFSDPVNRMDPPMKPASA